MRDFLKLIVLPVLCLSACGTAPEMPVMGERIVFDEDSPKLYKYSFDF